MARDRYFCSGRFACFVVPTAKLSHGHVGTVANPKTTAMVVMTVVVMMMITVGATGRKSGARYLVLLGAVGVSSSALLVVVVL